MGFIAQQTDSVFKVIKNNHLTEKNKYAAVEALLMQCYIAGAMEQRDGNDDCDLENEMRFSVAVEELAKQNLSAENYDKAKSWFARRIAEDEAAGGMRRN